MKSFFRLLPLTIAMIVPVSSIFFGGGGSSCGCQQPACAPPPPPCLPQMCLPQLPPIQIPSLCLPPLPRIQLPCPPPPCGGCGGGCGRKKRSTPMISRHHEETEATLCNNPQIRKIILTNITEDPIASKVAIHSELKAKLQGDYVVMCSSKALWSFIADTTSYCAEGTDTNSCYVFQM